MRPIDEADVPIARQLQRVCHDTLPWLISFSLDIFTGQSCRAERSILKASNQSSRQPRGWRRLLELAGAVILLYLAVAYVIMPLAWKREVRRHPQLFDAPRITHTSDGIAGDPVNVALLASANNLDPAGH
jgi:hypothetical protein